MYKQISACTPFSSPFRTGGSVAGGPVVVQTKLFRTVITVPGRRKRFCNVHTRQVELAASLVSLQGLQRNHSYPLVRAICAVITPDHLSE